MTELLHSSKMFYIVCVDDGTIFRKKFFTHDAVVDFLDKKRMDLNYRKKKLFIRTCISEDDLKNYIFEQKNIIHMQIIEKQHIIDLLNNFSFDEEEKIDWKDGNSFFNDIHLWKNP